MFDFSLSIFTYITRLGYGFQISPRSIFRKASLFRRVGLKHWLIDKHMFKSFNELAAKFVCGQIHNTELGARHKSTVCIQIPAPLLLVKMF